MDFDFDSNNENGGFGGADDGFGSFEFGEQLDIFFESEKKKEKKAEPKKKSVKSSSKNKDEDVQLPVTVVARGFKTVVDGSGKTKLSEIAKKLTDEGYAQIGIVGMGLFYAELSHTIYVTDNQVAAADNDTAVDLSDEKTITVIDGLLTATFSLEDFDGKDEDEITIKDVAEKFAAVNPSYAGCGLSYDGGEFSYPVFNSYENKGISLPAAILFKGNMEQYDSESITDIGSLKEAAFGTLPSGLSVYLGKTDEPGAYAACFGSSSGYYMKEKSAAAKTDSVKKVAQKYGLPLELYIVTFNCSYELKPEHFEGKEKVSLEEIKAYMADKQKMFSDKSRKLDTFYNEEKNMLAVMFISGSKGCEMIRTDEEFEACRKKEHYYGFYVGEYGSFRIRAFPHGNFISRLGRGRECITVMDVTFERKLPKIPGKILHNIIEYFREDLENEAMVRIVYNREKGEFSYYKAGGKKGKTFLQYVFDVNEEYMSPNMIQVMEIHSHNTMPAYFSWIDDADEKDYPGVFGVIGNLDAQNPSMIFRAGSDGKFQELDVRELFEYEG